MFETQQKLEPWSFVKYIKIYHFKGQHKQLFLPLPGHSICQLWGRTEQYISHSLVGHGELMCWNHAPTYNEYTVVLS